MTSRQALSATWVIMICAMFASTRGRCEVYQDTVVVPGTWVFSRFDCGCPPCLSPCPAFANEVPEVDFEYSYLFRPLVGLVLEVPSGVQPLGDIPLGDVHSVPMDGYVPTIRSDWNEELKAGRTYALRTRGGGHAVIRFSRVSLAQPAIMTYKYQDDGTGVFTGTSASHRTTWGLLKQTRAGH